MSNNPSISIIVPVLNEEGSLEIFYTETSKVLREYSDWEMIFVDDGSDDESFNIIRGIAEKDSHVTLIQFFKNFGKADALSEGFNQANGDIVIKLMQTFRMTRLKSPDWLQKFKKVGMLYLVGKKIEKIPLQSEYPPNSLIW